MGHRDDTGYTGRAFQTKGSTSAKALTQEHDQASEARAELTGRREVGDEAKRSVCRAHEGSKGRFREMD